MVAVLALVSAACSGNRGPDVSAVTDEPVTDETAAAVVPEVAAFGTLDPVCGDGSASGSSDQGVTDSEITIGYGDDAGFSANPGIGHHASDAMEALIAWCNDLGGINGRPIKGSYYDANFPSVIDFGQRIVGAVGTVGFEFLPCTIQYQISGVSDFRPYLQRLKDCGVETVMTVDVETNLMNVLDAANQLDYHPIWINIAASVYTETFAAANTNGNADRVYFLNGMVPLDDTPEGSANAKYVELVTEHGGDIGYVGQLATSAFLLWATAAKACGSDLTRECVLEHLGGVHEWTAGGLSSPQDPGSNMVGHCELVMKVEGTSYVQWEPTAEGQFACDESYAVKVDPEPDAMATLRLDGDRVAQKNLP